MLKGWQRIKWTLHDTYRIPGHTSVSFICIRNLHTVTLKSQIDTSYCYVLRTVVKYCYIKMEILLIKNTTTLKHTKIKVGIQKQSSKKSIWLCMSGNIQDKKLHSSVTSGTLSRIDQRLFVDWPTWKKDDARRKGKKI